MSDEPTTRRLPRRVYACVGLLSLAVLMLQIALNRLFSYTSWHHLAYISVSLALLGFGASGSLLATIPRLGGRSLRAGLSLYSALAALGAAAAFTVLGSVPVDFGDVLERPSQLALLILHFAVVSTPFFFAGLAIAIALREAGTEVGRLYFFDLVGAGLGCLLAVLAIDALGTPRVLGGMVLLFAAAGLVVAERRSPLTVLLLGLSATGAAAALLPTPASLAFLPSRDKLIAPWLEEGVTHYSRWGALFRTDLVGGREEEARRGGYRDHGISPGFRGASPAFRLIFHDGTAGALLYRVTGSPGEFEMFRHHVMTSPYLMLDRPEVLIVGVGGGADVVNALENGATRVVGAELDPLTVDLITREHADYTNHIFERPDVEIRVGEGRHFVRSTDDRFDLIQLTGVDTLAALSSGAYILAENYLYTVEAYRDFFHILRDDGLLSIAAVDHSPAWGYARHALRFASLSHAALRERGVERPHEHVMVISEPSGIAQFEVLTRLRPFTEQEIDRALSFLDAEGLEAWYVPGRPRRQLPSFRNLLEASEAGRGAFFAHTFLDLRPTRDDRPFFFSFYKWRHLLDHSDEIDPGHLLATGQLTLVLILALAICFSAVAILLPLAVGRHRERPLPGRFAFLAYFAALGAGFIFAEISFVQRFLLFLGHPLYSLSVILFSFLTAAGVGAHLSERLPAVPRRVLPALVGVLTLLVAAYVVLTPPLFDALLATSLAVRIAITVLLCAPLGGLLGMFFPYGIRLLTPHDPEFTAWAWAVNGCLTVVGSVTSVILATAWGFVAVIGLCLAIYWAGVIAFLRGHARLGASAPVE